MPSDGGASTADVYQQLYADHAGAVLTYLTNRLRDPDTAEDVAQTTWLKAHRHLPDVLGRGDTAGKPWLMRIATNAMLDHFRATKARPQTQDIDTALAPGSAFPDMLMEGETPEDVVVAGDATDDRRGRLVVAYLMLAPAERRLLWWVEVEGWSYARIAAALDTTVAAVKTRVWRVRERQRVLASPSPRRHAPPTENFWRLVEGGRTNGRQECWRWLGYHGRGGFAQFNLCHHAAGVNRSTCARRVAYALLCGPIPPWADLRPGCTHVWCVNPFHMVPCGKRVPSAIDRDPYAPLPAARPGRHLGDPADLRARREGLGLTRHRLAIEAGTAGPMVALLERGGFVTPTTVAQCVAALERLEGQRRAAGLPLRHGPPPDGPALRARRLALGIPAQDVARAAGLAPDGFWRIELSFHQGRLASCWRIAEALDRLEAERRAA